ncbi:WD-40 repeat-containing protein [Nostoc commune NIES-4072]|uniref:WD-40 repeat-containing protein n=1 Tax=Nostoc commune NIES-4072 TaxID=2005467 RepID=A0A2R5FJN0_NOSCO|nr:NB-ARC domain-containing protein [Nostoc commune]BBD63703.1 WD-40 repeat-containing protein [Nostoc commune HK-02]GBG18976.1 WD-40 repeat-containing protein [Nostoc commune NIES-4072]
MNVEEVLNFTDALIFAKKGKHLSDIQQLIIQAAWSGTRQCYDQIAQTNGYSPNYLKQDAGPKLWQLLSDIFGEKIKKSNFRAAVERQASLVSHESGVIHQDQIYLTDRCQDWGEAPDVSIFYGRSNELVQLEQWIVVERCRIVGLVGMGGIGKTHLSVKLAEQIQEQFDYVIWRSLRNAPSLQQILESLLQFIAKSQETDLPATLDKKISLLIDYFRKHRCLLVLDDVETILCGGDYTGFYKQGYEYYGDFFKRLGECRHNSCLVLISQEKPQEISVMQGETLPVRCLNLRGLSVSAGLQILQLKGCYCNLDAECTILIEQYLGNPLALKMVAEVIQELFEGNVGEFLKYNTLVIDEIRALLQQHLNRLSELENTVLYWLAINREPVSIEELQSDIYPCVSQQTLIKNLKSLVQRLLIETTANSFYLQPLLMEYASSLLIEQVCKEIETGELILLKSHILLKADAKDYIKKSQTSFIIQPIIDRLLVVFKNQSNLEIRFKEIISELQVYSPQESSYAAENILNLLCKL